MTPRDEGLLALPASLIEHVDQICERFERAWEEGRRPRIEDYLTGEDGPARPALLRELLAAELGHRCHLGESPEPADYLPRLAGDALGVKAAFEDARGEVKATAAAGGDATADYPPGGARPAPPSSVGPRFRVLRPHAEGGLGVVFLAHDAELNREVALKEIQPGLAARPESQARFLREAEITGGLEHPGIVPVYSLGRHPDGRPYYAMRLIRGSTLKEAIDAYHQGAAVETDPGTRSLAFRRLLERVRDVAEALEYAHSRGVVHRDVKPQNVMVGRFGETLLVDWGLAKAQGQPATTPGPGDRRDTPLASQGSAETATGSAVGTPAYMSPEQARGIAEMVGPASDVYGLGATLYHVLSGHAPLEGSTQDVMARARLGAFPKPRTIRRDVPGALEAVVMKAMALRPEDRYGSPRNLADDIELWLADEPVTAWHEPWSMRASRWLKSHRVALTAVTAALALTTVVLGACVLFYCMEHVHTMFTGSGHVMP
jgi:eukaryotic-like serine/threonine-protein kinase